MQEIALAGIEPGSYVRAEADVERVLMSSDGVPRPTLHILKVVV